jgi:hypothetical protein
VRLMLIEEQFTESSRVIQKYAAELADGATTPLEKARRIHDKVSSLHRGYAQALKSRNAADIRHVSGGFVTLDQMIRQANDHARLPIRASQYLWLQLALMRAAGLPARLIALPDRRVARFDVRMVAPPFLSELAVAVQIQDRWHVSDPLAEPSLPFGVMPWFTQGDIGLLAQEGKETFLPLRPTLAQDSLITTTAELQLTADGTLEGTVRRKITGQPAFNLRTQLLNTTETQAEVLQEQLEGELPGMTVSLRQVDGVEGIGTPIELVFLVSCPGYAVAAKDRLIVRAAALRRSGVSPFPAAERRKAVQFPYAWGEIDDLTIKLPDGYVTEELSPVAPRFEKGQFYHKVVHSFDAARAALRTRREFVLLQPDWLPEQYPQLKDHFDAVANSDRAELVFRKLPAGGAQ